MEMREFGEEKPFFVDRLKIHSPIQENTLKNVRNLSVSELDSIAQKCFHAEGTIEKRAIPVYGKTRAMEFQIIISFLVLLLVQQTFDLQLV